MQPITAVMHDVNFKEVNGTKQSAHLHNSINVHNNQSTFMQHLLTMHARKKVQTVP